MSEPLRSEGERIRLAHAVARHEQHVRALQMMRPHEIPGPDVGNAVVMSALEIATIIARMSAYQRAEGDPR